MASARDDEAERDQAYRMRGNKVGMQQPAVDPAGAFDRDVGKRGIGGGQGNENEREPAPAVHASRLRNTAPASAIAPPAARTATCPAGQRVSSPKAMPHRCSMPVATTKP